jgi:LacI family transcriptional regulator
VRAAIERQFFKALTLTLSQSTGRGEQSECSGTFNIERIGPIVPEADSLINQNYIAERLNLSTATVSRALRNQPGIHPATRSRVMEVAAELGYRPLRTRHPKAGGAKANFVGVFIRSLHKGVRPHSLDGMADMASQMNVSLVLHHAPLDAAEVVLDPDRQPPALRDGLLNGAILVHRWPAEVARYLTERMACVSIIHRVPGVRMDTVDIDHLHGMTLLGRHLHKLGHRRIGFFALNGEIAWAKARYGGYAQILCELGLPMDPSMVVQVPAKLLEDRTAEWHDEIDHAASLVKKGVTALMCASQWTASVLHRGLAARGLKIPKDVSITGFDDEDRVGLEDLKLTSTRVAGEAMGAEALRRVLVRMAEPSQPTQTISFACTFVEGQSTAAVPVLPVTRTARRTGDSAKG